MRKALAGILRTLGGLHPVKLVLLGYFSYILLGWVLLCLPPLRRGPVSALDGLFMATSAVSTTGLATVSLSGSYTFAGQVVVLLLIQVGGMGYMTFSSFVVLSRKRPLSDTRLDVAKTVFSLPKSFRIDKFIRSVLVFTATIELLGAVGLYFAFRAAGAPQPLWSSVFHTVSSFCTAGFSIYDSSLTAYRGEFWINLIVCFLSYLGAVGFIVCVDVWRKVTGKVQKVTLTTKIILHATFWIALVGTVHLFIAEPSIRSLPPEQRLLASAFQAMTAMTTVGFNTIPISAVSRTSLLLLVILMVIGASPSGTGGGLKSTTFSAMIGVMRSALRQQSGVRFWRCEIPEERVRAATATLCLYLTFLLLGTWGLTLTEEGTLGDLLFEAASALGTVGLSTGATQQLTPLGKALVTLLMFIGRLGPLTFGMALFLRPGTFTDDADSDMAV